MVVHEPPLAALVLHKRIDSPLEVACGKDGVASRRAAVCRALAEVGVRAVHVDPVGASEVHCPVDDIQKEIGPRTCVAYAAVTCVSLQGALVVRVPAPLPFELGKLGLIGLRVVQGIVGQDRIPSIGPQELDFARHLFGLGRQVAEAANVVVPQHADVPAAWRGPARFRESIQAERADEHLPPVAPALGHGLDRSCHEPELQAQGLVQRSGPVDEPNRQVHSLVAVHNLDGP